MMDRNITYIINGKKVNEKLVYSNFVESQFHSIRKFFKSSRIEVIQNSGSICKALKNAFVLRRTILPKSIIHVQYGTITSLTASMAKKRCSLIMSLCGDDILGSSRDSWKWKIRGNIGRWMSIVSCFFADIIIAKSPSIAAAVPKMFNSKIRIVPNGVNEEIFSPIAKSEAQKALGWNNKFKYVLFNPSSGLNMHVKNLPLAKQSIEYAKTYVSNIILVLIQNKSAQEICVMMNAADGLLLTSLHEGSPNIVKEAMCCNLPIVSVNCGDVKLRLRNVSNSFCMDSYDYRKIGQTLVEILSVGERSNGRIRLEEDELFISQIAMKLLKIYKSI